MSSVFAEDPGLRNIFLKSDTPAGYFFEYAQLLADTASRIEPDPLNKFSILLERKAAEKAHIFVAGNGGSAAIAEHLCCDFSKGTYAEDHPPIRTYSLSSNVALYSAVANDFGFESVFSAPLQIFSDPKDVLIAISSSGNSVNILKAVEQAKKKGLTTVGLTGFDGGKLRGIVDISIHVPFKNYGIVEDCHQMVMHSVAQYITTTRKS